jgi:hypothetical protein
MDKQNEHLLWLAAALTLGLVSAPPVVGSTAVEGEKAIDRLPEIRGALRGVLEDGKKSNKPSGLGKLIAQQWPNWTNWGNG